jgi:pimeloyl-ACP methyl ester carboxylesterase
VKRTIALAAVGALTLTSAVTATQAAASPTATASSAASGATSSTALTVAEKWSATLPKAKAIAWGKCDAAGLAAAGAVCGFLTVPLDWSKPTGATIKIAVSKVAHKVSAAKYQGSMIVNPGGPGGSGLGLSTLGSDVPNGAGNYYDWIGFDPRGVGSSVPSLSCISDYFAGPRPEYIPRTPALTKVWLARSKAYADACKKGGALLDHMTTIDVAKDMDYLRAALGQKQTNYYGFSYGTYLGQVYSTLFPTHVRRMVLDATVDPRGVWYKANLAQDVAFQKTVDIWFGWVAKYDSVYHLGQSAAAVKRLWYQQKAELTKHPAGGVVGPDEWVDIFLYAGYYQSVWTDLGNVFASWVHKHDLATLTAAYQDYVGPSDDNGFAVYNAVQCTDTQWPQSWATWRKDNWRTFQKAPFETWGNAWFNAPCLFWPAKAHTPVKIDGSKTKSVLMIDETLDAATPYEGSLYVRSLYPGARLIAEPGGTTHAGTLYGDTCVDGQIAAYLATGKLPARRAGYGADTYCAPLPRPVPTSSASSPAAMSAAHAAVLKMKSDRALIGR